MLNQYILNTYGSDQPDDGLSNVYHRIKHIAPLVDDSNSLKEKSVVLIAGIPTLYTNQLNSHHVNIIYTTFEHYPLPQDWIEAINLYQSAVIVPHQSIKTIFEESGVQVPIYVVQQGFTRFQILPDSNNSMPKFILGFLGIPVERKNLNTLIEAVELINKTDSIKLKVHVSKYYDWMSYKEVRSKLSSHPFIEYSEGYKTKSELASWYNSLSCYVFPSSKEGWSFTPRESLSLGIPTIISNIPVHEDLIPYSCNISTPINVEKIKKSIEEIILNYSEYETLAEKGSKWINERYQNEDVAKSIKSILDQYASFIY